MKMSAPLDQSYQLSMFSAEDFPVSPTPLPDAAKALKMTETSGQSSDDSFAFLDHDGSWRKTCQGYSQLTLDGSLEAFSEIWPRAGMTRNGTAYLLQPLAPLTNETASGLWATASARDWKDTPGMATTAGDRNRLDQLARQVYEAERQRWSSPTARDANTLKKVMRWQGSLDKGNELIQPLPVQVGGTLNPTWVEWLMGYPLGWTVCVGWGTRSSRK